MFNLCPFCAVSEITLKQPVLWWFGLFFFFFRAAVGRSQWFTADTHSFIPLRKHTPVFYITAYSRLLIGCRPPPPFFSKQLEEHWERATAAGDVCLGRLSLSAGNMGWKRLGLRSGLWIRNAQWYRDWTQGLRVKNTETVLETVGP